MLLKEEETLDPRVRRTRQLLTEAMESLLAQKELQEITVGEITDLAMVNRATFYAHFVDKYALFDHLIRESFAALLRQRLGESEDGFCLSDLQTLIATVFEYMDQFSGNCHSGDRQARQLVAQQVQSQLQSMIQHGIEEIDLDEADYDPELGASVMSWGIFGVALQWSHQKKRLPAETAAEQVMHFIYNGMSPVTDRMAALSGTTRAQ